jgi:hypothetical protein
MNGGRESRRPWPALGCSAIDDDETVARELTNKTITAPKDAFLAGLTTGLKHPRIRGPRL